MKKVVSEPPIPNQVKKLLSKKNSCFVIVACSNPSDLGDMRAEMFFEGDPVVASYLMSKAQELIERSSEEEDQGISV